MTFFFKKRLFLGCLWLLLRSLSFCLIDGVDVVVALLGGVVLGDGEGLAELLVPAVLDDDVLDGPVPPVGLVGLHLPDHVHALDHLAKDHVLAVQPGRLLGRDEELAAVGVLAGVGHAQPADAVVLQLEVLVVETVAVDGLAASAWGQEFAT